MKFLDLARITKIATTTNGIKETDNEKKEES